jgi:CelD/BcsL family acetyltransferase involved in cellulose biosynthesis
MTVRIIEHADEMEELVGEWNALAEPYKTPVVAFEWLRACAYASSPPGRLAIVLLRSSSRLRAVAPLMLQRRHGVPTLEMLGKPLCALSEPCDLLYEDESALRELTDALVALDKPLRLDRIPDASLTASVLGEVCRREISVRPRVSKTLSVSVSGTWREFEAGMSKSRRATLRRKLRMAEKLGEVRFETVSPTPETFPRYFRELLVVESAGWKARKGSAIRMSPYQRRFFRLYGEDLARLGLLRIFVMRINEQAVAMRLSSEYAGRIWEYKIGYDEQFFRCSPGILLTHETIRHVFEHRLKAHEFLGEAEEWEEIWANDHRQYLSFRIYPRSVFGGMGYGADAVRYSLKRARGLLTKAVPALTQAR